MVLLEEVELDAHILGPRRLGGADFDVVANDLPLQRPEADVGLVEDARAGGVTWESVATDPECANRLGRCSQTR